MSVNLVLGSAQLHLEGQGSRIFAGRDPSACRLAHDPALDQVFELGRLRSASQPEVNATLKAMLDQLLPKK